MRYNYTITILTPAYNRADLLPRLYESLTNQTYQNFQWLVIDDGSVDNTLNTLEQLKISDHKFLLEFYTKSNGGKHTALNFSHKFIKGEWTCIVDSDDWLVPNAIQEMVETIKAYSFDDTVKVISFLKGRSESSPVNTSFPKEPVISNHIDFRVNARRGGDCCEIIVSDVFKRRVFPEYKGEKFLGEGYLWNYTGFHYNCAYINKVLYICEYLEGGLSRSGRSLRIKCPYGGMANSNSFFGKANNRRVRWSIQNKEALLFVCYADIAGLGFIDTIKRCKNHFLAILQYIPGIILSYYWRKKYI